MGRVSLGRMVDKMKTLKEGSKWSGSGSSDVFIVLHTVELDGHTWVHYRKIDNDKEYSCYLESFIERFRALPE
jgi:hypothetical protein